MAGRKPEPDPVKVFQIGMRTPERSYLNKWKRITNTETGETINDTQAFSELVDAAQRFMPDGAIIRAARGARGRFLPDPGKPGKPPRPSRSQLEAKIRDLEKRLAKLEGGTNAP